MVICCPSYDFWSVLLFVPWRHLKQIWMSIEMHSRFKFFVDPSTNLEMHCQIQFFFNFILFHSIWIFFLFFILVTTFFFRLMCVNFVYWHWRNRFLLFCYFFFQIYFFFCPSTYGSTKQCRIFIDKFLWIRSTKVRNAQARHSYSHRRSSPFDLDMFYCFALFWISSLGIEHKQWSILKVLLTGAKYLW